MKSPTSVTKEHTAKPTDMQSTHSRTMALYPTTEAAFKPKESTPLVAKHRNGNAADI
jgi:hypothetical protein